MLDNNKCDCVCYEANFELASNPIEVNLELKTYQEKTTDCLILYFSKEDWGYKELEEETIRIIEINPKDYNFKSCYILGFDLYDDTDGSYHSALCDYAYNTKTNTINLYSDVRVTCRVTLFGILNL